MKKKKYVKPLVTVIGMEAEPVMASFSSYNPGGDPTDPSFDIIEGEEGMPGNDGTDLENPENRYGVKSHSVWD